MIYYRISDNSYPKMKLPGTNKEFCLSNFIRCFGQEKTVVIADNCKPETIKMVQAHYGEIVETNLSNAGSLSYALYNALALPDEEVVFFVEDDYLHREGLNLMQIIKEGLEKSDYVTLYDHPDKYQSEYEFGEISQVCKTKSTHWRQTTSTCMTFASTAKQLKEDAKVWEKYTRDTHPQDHKIFTTLAKKLLVSIPGLAFHTDLTYPLQKNMVDKMIEPWVYEYMEKELDGTNLPREKEFEGFRRLMLLDAHYLMKQKNRLSIKTSGF